MSTSNNTLLQFACIFFAIWLSACTSDPVVSTPNPTIHALHVGDRFVYHRHSTDEHGIAIDGSDTTVTTTVAATNIEYAGMNNTSLITEGSDSTYLVFDHDSVLFIWEAEIPIMNGISLPARWIGLPLRAGASVELDTSVNTSISGTAAIVTMKMSSEFVSSDSVTIGAHSYAAKTTQKVVTVDVAIPMSGQTYTTTVAVEYRFVPAIGYIAQKSVTTNSNSSFSPMPNGSVVDDLIDITLR
jgi:hypothetical protein